MDFTPELTFKEKLLVSNVIRVADVMDQEFCGSLCFMELNCVSYNFKILASQTGEHKFELNNATHEAYEHNLEENPYYVYLGVKVKYLVKVHGKKVLLGEGLSVNRQFKLEL